MFFSTRHFKNFSRICLILVYVSFYLVQLNVHFGETPVSSFQTGDVVSSQQSDHSIAKLSGKNSQKDSKATKFRLNKRFHPSHLFTAPEQVQDLEKRSFSMRVTLLNETQPLTNYSFNAPSLRGPPGVV